MKKLMIFSIVWIAFISCNFQSGNGNVRDEPRELSEIHSISTSGSIDVEIVVGDHYAMTVENDENLLRFMITEVNSGRLDIHYKEGISFNNDHPKVTVTVVSLDKINTSGSGNVTGNGVIKSSNPVELKTSGSGDIQMELDAPAISVTGSGSGNVNLSGRTKDFDCKITGSGDVNCSGLKSENAVIKVAGSSDVHVFASVSLKVNISGSGNVYYSGNPSSPEFNIAGSGKVRAEAISN
jgi:hypothetical protein